MKKISRAVIVFSLILPWALSWADEYEVEERLQSDYGEIQTVRKVDAEGYRGPPSTILLNGKEIFQAEADELYLTLHGIYHSNAGQAVLFSRSCGGSGCRISPLSFLLLKKHSRPTVVTNDNFFSETSPSDEIKGKEETGKVVIDLGHYKQQKKTAILDLGRLNVLLTEDPAKNLSDDHCKTLYEARDACVREHKRSSRCTDYSHADFSSGGFSGSNAEVWAVRRVSHYPGFNRKGFIETCNWRVNQVRRFPMKHLRRKRAVNLANNHL